MKVKEFIESMRVAHAIEFRDSNNCYICETISNRSGVEPYLECKIIEWMSNFAFNNHKIIILIDLEDEEIQDEEIQDGDD